MKRMQRRRGRKMQYVLLSMVVLGIIGAGSFYHLKKTAVPKTAAETMEAGKLPLLSVCLKESKVNMMQPYIQKIDVSQCRDSIIPLEAGQEITFSLERGVQLVDTMQYALYKIGESTCIESGVVHIERSGQAVLRIKQNLDSNDEYGLQIIASLKSQKKIYYNSRIRKINDCHWKEKLQFIQFFHENSLHLKTAQKIQKYLEPDWREQSNDLKHVTIHSQPDWITYHGFQTKVLEMGKPKIKEISEETAVVELPFLVQLMQEKEKKIYLAKEYYRVRYTQARMYLLHYERFLEALMPIEQIRVGKQEIQLEGKQASDIQLFSNHAKDQFCFVKMGELWYKQIQDPYWTKVFGSMEKEIPELDNGYDQYQIKILSMDENGKISFLVFGRFNRGSHEGMCGAILYQFDAKEREVVTKLVLPIRMPYQKLKEAFEPICELNHRISFSLFDKVWTYDLEKQELNRREFGDEDAYQIISLDGKMVVWQKNRKEICIFDLQTEKKKRILAKKGEYVQLLGVSTENVIYGTGKQKEWKGIAVHKVWPVHQIMIIRKNGELMEKYGHQDQWITGIQIKETMIILKRAKLIEENGRKQFKRIRDDAIIDSMMQEEEEPFLKEGSFYFPNNAVGKNAILNAKYKEGEVPLVTDLQNQKETRKCFEVYALGGILGKFSKQSDAIALADEKMGTVCNEKGMIIWERDKKTK